MPARRSIAYAFEASAARCVLVRGRRRGNRIDTETLHEGAGPLPEPLRRAIEQDVQRGLAVTAASLPPHESVIRALRAPFARLDQARRILPSLLDVQLPFPLEKAVHLFTGAVPSPEGGLDLLGVAARIEDVERAVARTRDAGLDPVELHHEGLVLWSRECGEDRTAGKVRCLLHIGAAHSTFVWGRGGRLIGVFSARVNPAEPAGLDALASRMASWLRTLPEEIREQASWRIAGLVPGTADLARLKSAGGLPAAAAVAADAGTYLARALAGGALAGDDHLRIGPTAHPAARALSEAHGRRSLRLALAAAAAVMTAALALPWATGLANDRLQERIAQRAAELAGVPAPRGQEVLTVKRAFEAEAGKTRTFDLAMRGGHAGDLFALVDRARQAGIVLRSLRSSLTSWTIEGEGDAESLAYVLRNKGWQVKVTAGEGRAFVLEGRRT